MMLLCYFPYAFRPFEELKRHHICEAMILCAKTHHLELYPEVLE